MTWRYVDGLDRDAPMWRRMAGVWVHRALLHRMALRDVRLRYVGASLGLWWAAITPLLFVGAYTLLFTFLFRARLTPGSSPAEYALYVVTGLLPWVAFTEVATRATQTMAEHRNLVKFAMFPLQVLPLTGMYAAMLSQLAGLIGALVFSLIIHGDVSWSLLWLVPATMAQLVFLAGTAWLLGAVGAVVRDVREILQIVLTAGMFFTPIFYRTDDLPALVAQVVGLNPLTPLLGAYRAALLGTAPDPVGLAVFTGFSLMLLVGGFITFERVRSELSDIL